LVAMPQLKVNNTQEQQEQIQVLLRVQSEFNRSQPTKTTLTRTERHI
jgi:hypothetical protein